MTDPARDTGDADGSTRVGIRRAPRLGVFVGLGAVLGVLATLILTSLYPADPAVGFAALFGYFALFGVSAGVILGATVGIVLDWRSRRRVRTVRVERESTVSDDGIVD